MSGLILVYNQGFSWMEEAATREKSFTTEPRNV